MSIFKDMDIDRLKVIFGYTFGFSILAIYFVLALAIGLGHVAKDTSYGLDIVLQALGPLGGLFCGWAFGVSQGSK